MIEKQREKEFLFELERLYHSYSLVIRTCNYRTILMDANRDSIDETTEVIEDSIDILRWYT